MPTTITVKNVPTELYDLLKQNAAIKHRSINNEVISIIEDAMQSKRINPEDFLVSVRRLREKTKEFALTEDIINLAKNEGRP